MIGRRRLLAGAACLAAARSIRSLAAPAPEYGGCRLRDAIAALDKRSGGRLGVALLHTGGRRRFGWRADEPFPLCSTFKFLLVAAVLARVDRGAERLDRRLPVPPGKLVDNSPFAQSRAGGAASVRELCQAAIGLSDNEAANLLLATTGGPDGVTRFARAIGDPVSRLDRVEPLLGTAPGDVRDTTSPRAMVGDIERVLLGNVLKPASAARLTRWLLATTTGPRRLRAGLPAGWSIGHKTGTGANGTANDVAIIRPPRGAPLIVAAYLTGSTLGDAGQDAILAGVAQAIAEAARS
jgi:beta-lactamase class A